MPTAVMILMIGLAFVLGAVLGVVVTLVMIARDDTVVRLRKGDVIVREDILEQLAKRAKVRMQGKGISGSKQDEDDDGE